jgi:glycosyltransferase involved in cell wall biosynthesis
MSPTDVLIVSLSGTGGLREADEELVGALRRAGAAVELVRAAPVREWRTFAAIELAWALSARRAAADGIARFAPRAVVYSSTTAALLAPRPGAIRFDAPAAGNRPARHGVWQRPVERRRLAAAPALIPWAADLRHPEAIVVPPPVDPSGRPGGPDDRDIAAITYGANPEKKGLDLVLAAWSAARRPDEELVVAGIEPRPSVEGVRWVGSLPAEDYRALLRRARVYLTAPRREDFGIAQLEALADGCMLVTAPAPGAYAALPLARALDRRLVSRDLAAAARAALDDPAAGYADRAASLLEPYATPIVDRLVADRLLPALLGG